MKRQYILIFIFLFIAAVFSGCSENTNGGKEKPVGDSKISKSISEDSISKGVSESKNAVDYLPTCAEMRDLLTKYFSQKGINFNDWIQSGAENNIFKDPDGSGAIVESNGCLTFSIETQRDVVLYSPDNSISDTVLIIRSWSYDVYEMLSYIISEIPYQLKPTTNELKGSTQNITTGYSEPIRSGGLQYKIGINNGKAVEIIITRE